MILLIFWVILESIPKIYSTELCLTFTNSNLNPKSYFLAVVVEFDDSYYSTKYPIVSIHSADNMHRFPIESFYDANNLIYPDSPTFFDDKGIAFSIPNILGCFAPTCKCLFFSASGKNVMFWSSTNRNDNIFSEYVDIELNETACGTMALHDSYIKDNFYAVSDLANLSPSAVIWTMFNMNQISTYVAIFVGTIIALSAMILCAFMLFICVILRTPSKKPMNQDIHNAFSSKDIYSDKHFCKDFASSSTSGPVRRIPQSKSGSVLSSSRRSQSHNNRHARSNNGDDLTYSQRDCDEISVSSTSSYGSSRQESPMYRDVSPSNSSRGYDRHPSSSSSCSGVKTYDVNEASQSWSNNLNHYPQPQEYSNLNLPSQSHLQSRPDSPSQLQYKLPMHYNSPSHTHNSCHIHNQVSVPTSSRIRAHRHNISSHSNNQSRHHGHNQIPTDSSSSTHLNIPRESPLLRRSPSSATFMSDPSIGTFLSDPGVCQNSTEGLEEISTSFYNRSRSHNNMNGYNVSNNLLSHEGTGINESSSVGPAISLSTYTSDEFNSSQIHSIQNQNSNQRGRARTLSNHSQSYGQPPPYTYPQSGFSPTHRSCSQAHAPPTSQGHNQGYNYDCSPPKNRGYSSSTTNQGHSQSDHDCTQPIRDDLSRSSPNSLCIIQCNNQIPMPRHSQGYSPSSIQSQSPGRKPHGSREVTSRGYPVVRAGTKLSGLPTSRDRLATVRNWAIARESNQTKVHTNVQLQSEHCHNPPNISQPGFNDTQD